MLALAWLDGWGEEWCEIGLEVARAARLIAAASGADVSSLEPLKLDDFRRHGDWEQMAGTETTTDWNAMAAAFRSHFAGV